MIENYFDRIKELCLKNKIQLTDFAKLIGVSRPTIFKWRNSEPHLSTILKMCEVFNISLYEFLKMPILDSEFRDDKNDLKKSIMAKVNALSNDELLDLVVALKEIKNKK